MKQKIKENFLVTGCAGFIGMHLCKSLLNDGFEVCGIDNMNSYYDKSLKNDRKNKLISYKNFSFEEVDIANFKLLNDYFNRVRPKKVVNLAAQAGVRYSIENPHAYIDSNVAGFMNILECCKKYSVDGLIYASSSSVYGENKVAPFKEEYFVNDPVSIYAATKISNELMAKSYNNLFGLKSTGLRFFTVYGPWGRPDMAYYMFTKKILKNEKIEIFNFGDMERDFTHINDIIWGIKSSLIKNYDCEIFNLGNSKSEKILNMVNIIQTKLGKKAIIDFKSHQLGDVKKTYADISKANKMLSFKPKMNFKDGLEEFVDWYVAYNKINY